MEFRKKKFWGYGATQRGIEVNPKKIQALLDMKPSHTINEKISVRKLST